MGNLRDNNRQNPKLRVNMDEYWDFVVSHDALPCSNVSDGEFCGDNIVSYIDVTDPECVDGEEWIQSKPDFVWENGYANEHDMINIGYTGVDNGLYKYRKDRITNQEFFDIFTKSKYHIDEGDLRLKLHTVSGTHVIYDYPLHIDDDSVKLNGGFYQGFFRTECGKYNILPHKIDDAWSFDFTLKKCDLKPESHKTLNDKYPNNKGIFFYIGTRAENKWVYLYEKDDCFTLSPDDYVEDSYIDPEGYIINNFFGMYDSIVVEPDACELDWDDIIDYSPFFQGGKVMTETPTRICNKKVKSRCCKCSTVKRCEPIPPSYDLSDVFDIDESYFDSDYVEDEIDISYFDYKTDNGLSISGANDYYFYTDNKFMLFDRTKDGYTVNSWEEGTKMMFYGKKNKFKGNLFMLMNRTKTGYTVNTIQDLIDEANSKYDGIYKDIWNNAFALRITDEGAIGYRYIVPDCSGENDYEVKEGYSDKGIVPDCEWFTVHVRIEADGKMMRVLFYVNGKLVYITDEMPKLKLRALDELNEKQEGVPFNISLGGGTQGLADVVQRNYMLDPSRVYPLEEHFAGSFIGYLKNFRFHNGWVGYDCIKNNSAVDLNVSTANR